MKKDFILDYFGCIVFRVLGPLIRNIPKGFALFLGRRIGDLMYYCDMKHRLIVCANIKVAFAEKMGHRERAGIAKGFYRNFGQNIIEIFFIPLIDERYVQKYITIEGRDYITEGFKRGKGIIFAGVHEGSWELSNIISANLGIPFVLFVRDQKYPRLNRLLNAYRIQKGGKIIQRQSQTRRLIEAFKQNEAIGMTIDQGGRNGVLVEFFGKEASMSTGAVRLALKYDVTILSVFFMRLKGPYHKIIISPPFTVKRTGVPEKDIVNNLQALVTMFETRIAMFPKEYFWSYKIWKYSRQKNILILSDGKTGHLRQTQAVAATISDFLKDKRTTVSCETREVAFRNKFSSCALTICGGLLGKYACQGRSWSLSEFLSPDSYKTLMSVKPDIVISCGSSLASVNYILASDNQAKSIVIQRPSVLSMHRFDLVVMPRHDRPPLRKNIVLTGGALNVIDETYLREQSEKLMVFLRPSSLVPRLYIGFLIGGDTKHFYLSKDTIKVIIHQIKCFAEKADAGILVTTSRRTSSAIEHLVREEFEGYSRCALLVIANKTNLAFAVGGILGLSRAVIVSPESISMISEAASAGRHILVFKAEVSRRHRDFLNHLAGEKYIYLAEPQELCSAMDTIVTERPKIYTLDDKAIVRNALEKIL